MTVHEHCAHKLHTNRFDKLGQIVLDDIDSIEITICKVLIIFNNSFIFLLHTKASILYVLLECYVKYTKLPFVIR